MGWAQRWRLVLGDRLGAAREIHGGSGYWSQDSVVQVMGCPETPTQIWVHWPGGKNHHQPHPDWSQGDRGGHGGQADGESKRAIKTAPATSSIVSHITEVLETRKKTGVNNVAAAAKSRCPHGDRARQQVPQTATKVRATKIRSATRARSQGRGERAEQQRSALGRVVF
jgi:hypothetical protein